jgi:hypothetical protein
MAVTWGGDQWMMIEGHSHLVFSKMDAANPLKNLRTIDWNAHKAFRLLDWAQLHLRQAEAVYRPMTSVSKWVGDCRKEMDPEAQASWILN